MSDGKKKKMNLKNVLYISSQITDDWETEADYENKQTEDEQRWGKDVNRAGAIE